MLQRQVYRMPKTGSIKTLQLQTETLPNPQLHEVTVKVKSIGLNFADIPAMQGLYSAAPKGPFIPGLEFAGEIIAVGTQAGEWKVGDKVMGATKFGGYVSHINSHHRYVVPLPAQWSFEEGAGFLVQGLTAYYALKELGHLQKGQTILIHSAAGGVGLLANRICKAYDCYTIGTVGNAGKADFLQKQEAYNAVIVRGSDFETKLRQVLGNRPLDMIMECIGGRILKQGWKVMAMGGRMIAYGNASFSSHGARPNWPLLLWNYLRRPKIDPLQLPTENKSIMGFNLIYLYEQTELMHTMLHELQALQLRPQHIGHVFSFHEMHSAIQLFQQGKTVGKVVVKVN